MCYSRWTPIGHLAKSIFGMRRLLGIFVVVFTIYHFEPHHRRRYELLIQWKIIHFKYRGMGRERERKSDL